MRLTILGSAGTFPSPDSGCSSYLVEHEGFRLLVDMGNGSTGALQQVCGLLGPDAVLISHLHGDHFLDLVTYTYARRYHPDGVAAPLPVYSPAGLPEQIAGACGLHEFDALLRSVYDFRPLTQPQRLEVGPFVVDLDLVNHPLETYGMRIAAGDRTLAYSADTAESPTLVALADAVDVLLCEASYLDGEDNPPDIHLTGHGAGQTAARAGVDRLLLTHLVPWGDPDRSLDAASRAFSGNIDVARSLDSFDI